MTRDSSTPQAELSLDELCIHTIRFLAADAVEKASSGHPGLPMGVAAPAYVLWTRFLRHNPANPGWIDRDRFVLSAGHGSMLLYALLHLTGYDLPMEEILSFRQWSSRTPGHPEAHLTPGVEATTGPLGQGIANAVGMAIAEAHLAACFNRPGHEIIDHRTWVIASDGDLMEGVASEACSLAGHLRLGKLTVLFDDNRVSLAGSTSLTFTEDVAKRFDAYGWHVERVVDGNDIPAIAGALEQAKKTNDRPSMIMVRTTIGDGAPTKAGRFEAHGAPLGADELAAAKSAAGWPLEPAFHVPEPALERFRAALAAGRRLENEWSQRFEAYRSEHPDLAAELQRVSLGRLPRGWDDDLPAFATDTKGLPTRKASEKVLQALSKRLPELVGGSADLNPSTFTWIKEGGDFQHPTTSTGHAQGAVGGVWSYAGRNVHFGVREHAMGAAVNGMLLHGGLIGYGSTFLVFSDYMRPAIRLSALSDLGCIWVFTHDSIGLGEDGPTHQPIEHYAALRAIPNLVTIRPADANETTVAWQLAVESRNRPTALILTRQSVPTLDRDGLAPPRGVRQGAYVLNPGLDDPDLILLASGSEVALIVGAADALAADGVRARMVSVPSWELFEEQPARYRQSVLLPSVTRRLAVEAGVSLGWERFVGEKGDCVTLDRFGASAPAARVMSELGFTVDHVVERARKLLREERS